MPGRFPRLPFACVEMSCLPFDRVSMRRVGSSPVFPATSIYCRMNHAILRAHDVEAGYFKLSSGRGKFIDAIRASNIHEADGAFRVGKRNCGRVIASL